eukprot:CAMPEP_0204276130 /NCGR_PEP_ID=MMETSP0468-20130131/27368_1 /ASSEMBLY_ACC=CAM_ASM_000383 /TAXON_ID=2969 /ORGANISM="Oxyrrhis marina" /LENGTH=418 /DNA_ID=CAMNT_0051252643 /DNA_START=23 /DNA_END=1279 /DNA_ORIENTATION=+
MASEQDGQSGDCPVADCGDNAEPSLASLHRIAHLEEPNCIEVDQAMDESSCSHQHEADHADQAQPAEVDSGSVEGGLGAHDLDDGAPQVQEEGIRRTAAGKQDNRDSAVADGAVLGEMQSDSTQAEDPPLWGCLPMRVEADPDRFCRICHGGSEEGRLISPCMCNGSMRYVHLVCLEEWRQASANSRSYFECETCKYRYQFSRTKWADMVTQWWVLHLLTLLGIILLIGLAGYIGKLFAICPLQYSDGVDDLDAVPPTWAWSWFLSPFNIDHFVSGSVFVGMSACGSLMLQVRPAWFWPSAGSGGKTSTLILAVLVIIGLIRAAMYVHEVVKNQSVRVLWAAEIMILEVDHAKDKQAEECTTTQKEEAGAINPGEPPPADISSAQCEAAQDIPTETPNEAATISDIHNLSASAAETAA